MTDRPKNLKELDKITDGIALNSGGVLLHCCCGPCATAVVERLLSFVKPVLYYYNPNIQPRDEYEKRLVELRKVAEKFSVPLIAEEYDESEFTSKVVGYEREKEGGARCPLCFSLRLDKTATKAKELDLPYFCTTLTVSPHKNASLINEIGYQIEERTGVKWLPSDFKKRDGYRRSVILSQELDLYRQNYCGCLFGKEEN